VITVDMLDLSEPWSTLVEIAIIILIAIIARVILGLSIRRLVRAVLSGAKAVSKNGKSDRLASERINQRGKTIGSVLDNLATWTLTITALVMVLSSLGVNVGALIAVSTILGAAIGFGAQSLVKDIISGIFIVFEDQYGVGDWVELGTISGEVERVRLRVTEVRDIQGTLWFVRNGEILSVGNSSQEWAKALLDLAFAYDNDLEQVKDIIKSVAQELRDDSKYGPQLLSDVEIVGVQHISGEQFVLRVAVKTLPNKQWGINRELRLRLKAAFDRNQITLMQASKINLAN
jgi:moderate conductance mechanosensitive channel